MGGVLSSVKYYDGVPYHALNDFSELKPLDRGGYGTVLKGYGIKKGSWREKQTVAIKIFFNEMDKCSEREIDILKKHAHPNIVQLFGVIWDGDFVDKNASTKMPKYTGYVMEYMERGSLHKATRIHLKLADFGMARTISGNHTYTSGIMGTDPYMAPEVVGTEKNYGPPADVYSLGVTIWEIVKRKCTQRNVSGRPLINEILLCEPKQTILIIDSNGRMTVLSPDRSNWVHLQLEIPIYVIGSIYLDEEIYILGVVNGKSLYKLDKNLEWIRLADMNIGRVWIRDSCLAWNGYIWVFGGEDRNEEPLKSVERYDPKTNKWTPMPDMIHPRAEAAATVCNDRIIVSGGFTKSFENLNSVECFNLKDGTWTKLPSLPNSVRHHYLISYKNKIIAMGGRNRKKQAKNKVYELDPLEENPKWKSLPPMKYPAYDFTGIVLDDEIYAIGGCQLLELGIEYLDRVEIFDGNQWRDGPQIPFEWDWKSSAMIIPQSLADRLSNYNPK